MNHSAPQIEAELKAERRLLEAAVAEARADPRPSVSHDQVHAEMLLESEQLNRSGLLEDSK